MGNSERVALVSGASRGIGAAILATLAQRGHITYGTATSERGAERISARLSDRGLPGRGLLMRAEQPESMAAAVATVTEERSAPLLLVNNLGITRDALLMRMKERDWRQVIDVNLGSVYYLCKECARGMVKARWGRIVNIISVLAMMGGAGQCNYSASKAGIAGFSRSLACELAARGITVNCIAPGFIDTDMTEKLPPPRRQAILERVPAQRFGEPQEVADLASFLCGDEAAYITGETINISGGLYMS